MVINTTFNNISATFLYIMAVSFIGEGSREYPEKTTNLSQVNDNSFSQTSYVCMPTLQLPWMNLEPSVWACVYSSSTEHVLFMDIFQL